MSALLPKRTALRLIANISSKRGFKYETVEIKDEEFRMLVIPGYSKKPEDIKRERRPKAPVLPPRFKSMPVDQDWTNVWPTAKSASWSTLPFPVRMGYIEGTENDGIVPGAYANAELMKIPNFLHLTPAHIKKHCAAIKQFCTPWPNELKSNRDCTQHFPITITTRDYIFDGPSLKDERARIVTLTINLNSLKLDYHAKDKLKRLALKAYDSESNCLILESKKCPMKKQNYDYLMYLLTALYKESCKTEAWEGEKTLQDMEKYFWDINASKKNVVEYVKKIADTSKENPDLAVKSTEKLSKDPSEGEILSMDIIKKYKNSMEKLMNEEKPNKKNIEEYKSIVKKLLDLK